MTDADTMTEGSHFDWTEIGNGHACQIVTFQGGSPISYGCRVRSESAGAAWGVALHTTTKHDDGFEIDLVGSSCMAHGVVHCPHERAIEQTIGVAKLMCEHVVGLLVEAVRRIEGDVEVASVSAETLRSYFPTQRTVH